MHPWLEAVRGWPWYRPPALLQRLACLICLAAGWQLTPLSPCEHVHTHPTASLGGLKGLLSFTPLMTAGGGGIVILDAPFVDIASMTTTALVSTSAVNVSGGASSCGSHGGAGVLLLDHQQWILCYSGVSTPHGLTVTEQDLVCSLAG